MAHDINLTLCSTRQLNVALFSFVLTHPKFVYKVPLHNFGVNAVQVPCPVAIFLALEDQGILCDSNSNGNAVDLRSREQNLLLEQILLQYLPCFEEYHNSHLHPSNAIGFFKEIFSSVYCVLILSVGNDVNFSVLKLDQKYCVNSSTNCRSRYIIQVQCDY